MRESPVRLVLVAVFAAGLGSGTAPAHADSDVWTAVVGLLSREEPLVLDGIEVPLQQLRGVYEGQTESRLWRDRVDSVTAVLADASAEGLDPRAYHLDAIAARAADDSDEGRATRELLVTAAVLRYAGDVRYGKSRPRLTSEVSVEAPPDPVALVRTVAAASDASAAMRDLPPRHPQYRALRAALAQYRTALAEGREWPKVPAGPSIRPGMHDAGVPAVRARLVASGELASAETADPRRHDPALVDAVKVFEEKHGLAPDGVVGQRVRDAMNVGLATRVEQIQVNMERTRWLPEDLGTTRVTVNVAAARMRFVEDGTTLFEGPVIVGQAKTRTPSFSSQITQVIFNPTWTVPESIARKELLPKAARDQGYLSRQGINLIGYRPPPPEDDPERASWRPPRNVTLRQRPGPSNPLGRVKFHIPNGFGVYLHDTNNRGLFTRDKRTLSHGCVRVGNALGFADEVLGREGKWSPERKARILSGWSTTHISLERPIPVHIMYETAWVDEHERLHFAEDVYDRDSKVADVLAGRSASPAVEKVQTALP